MNTTQVQNNHRRNLYDSVSDHAECSVQLMFDFVKKILGIIELGNLTLTSRFLITCLGRIAQSDSNAVLPKNGQSFALFHDAM